VDSGRLEELTAVIVEDPVGPEYVQIGIKVSCGSPDSPGMDGMLRLYFVRLSLGWGKDGEAQVVIDVPVRGQTPKDDFYADRGSSSTNNLGDNAWDVFQRLAAGLEQAKKEHPELKDKLDDVKVMHNGEKKAGNAVVRVSVKNPTHVDFGATHGKIKGSITWPENSKFKKGIIQAPPREPSRGPVPLPPTPGPGPVRVPLGPYEYGSRVWRYFDRGWKGPGTKGPKGEGGPDDLHRGDGWTDKPPPVPPLPPVPPVGGDDFIMGHGIWKIPIRWREKKRGPVKKIYPYPGLTRFSRDVRDRRRTASGDWPVDDGYGASYLRIVSQQGPYSMAASIGLGRLLGPGGQALPSSCVWLGSKRVKSRSDGSAILSGGDGDIVHCVLSLQGGINPYTGAMRYVEVSFYPDRDADQFLEFGRDYGSRAGSRPVADAATPRLNHSKARPYAALPSSPAHRLGTGLHGKSFARGVSLPSENL